MGASYIKWKDLQIYNNDPPRTLEDSMRLCAAYSTIHCMGFRDALNGLYGEAGTGDSQGTTIVVPESNLNILPDPDTVFALVGTTVFRTDTFTSSSPTWFEWRGDLDSAVQVRRIAVDHVGKIVYAQDDNGGIWAASANDTPPTWSHVVDHANLPGDLEKVFVSMDLTFNGDLFAYATPVIPGTVPSGGCDCTTNAWEGVPSAIRVDRNLNVDVWVKSRVPCCGIHGGACHWLKFGIWGSTDASRWHMRALADGTVRMFSVCAGTHIGESGHIGALDTDLNYSVTSEGGKTPEVADATGIMSFAWFDDHIIATDRWYVYRINVNCGTSGWTDITPTGWSDAMPHGFSQAMLDQSVAYISDNVTLYKTTGGSLTALTNKTVLGVNAIRYASVHPLYPDTVYLALQGGTNAYYVLVSYDGGLNWTNKTGTGLANDVIEVKPLAWR